MPQVVDLRVYLIFCAELAKQNFDIFFTYWGPYDRQMPWTVEIDEPKQIQEEIVRLGVGCECMETLTKTISQEIAKKGITIIAVNPGPTDPGWMDEELTALILSKSPMGRVGTPRDTARLIAFLASEEAQWITGQIIHSEGGFTR